MFKLTMNLIKLDCVVP